MSPAATLTAPATVKCPRCKGKGKDPEVPALCSVCRGRCFVPVAPRVPVTHRVDPVTSAMAEREINATGERDRQIEEVYAAVCRWPGRTYSELAALLETLNEHQVAKRAADIAEARDGAAPRKVVLIERGPARVCEKTGRPCQTWWKLGEAPNSEGA